MVFKLIVVVAALSAVSAVRYTNVETNIDDLIAVVQVHRHGERSPTSFVANDPYADIATYWPHGTGQLSNEGKQRHYALGKFTRRRYGAFLPDTYNNSFFRAQTTDVDRTHMSVQCNVAAIFPPSGDDTWRPQLPWQPIPVHAIPENVFSGGADCPIFYSEWLKALVSVDPFAQIDAENAELYKFLTNVTGSTISSILTASSVYDALLIEDLNGLELPSWASSVYPQPLKTISAYMFLSFSYTDDQKRLMAGSFLNTVATLFESLFKDPTSAAKYQIYSAHDSNIASILNTLGVFEPHNPWYASSIYIELRNKSNTPVVNVWHKDDDLEVFEPITIKGCDFDCSIANFRTVLGDWLINTTQWDELCSSTDIDLSSVSDSEYLLQYYEHAVAHHDRKKGRPGVSPIMA